MMARGSSEHSPPCSLLDVPGRKSQAAPLLKAEHAALLQARVPLPIKDVKTFQVHPLQIVLLAEDLSKSLTSSYG